MKKKYYLFILIIYFVFRISRAVTILDSAPEDTPTPIKTKIQSDISKKQKADTAKSISQRTFGSKGQEWIAPAVAGEENPIGFILNSVIQNDSSGSQVFSLLDIGAKRDLDEYSVRAEGMVRIKKIFSNSDITSFPVELRVAKISYLESWLQVSVGRMDLTGILSPTSFFGFYPTMGVRRLDGVSAVLPIRFAFGGEDIKGVTTPPTSLSLYYFPSIFSPSYVELNGQQAYLLGQARLRVTTDDIQTNFRANIGGSSTDYFNYSSVSGNPAFSFCIDSEFSKQYTLYGEYGIQNLSLINGTGALVLGAKAERIGTWDSFSLDLIDFEVQIPVGQDPNNAFTGGNTYFPRFALLPQIAWYGGAKIRLKSFFLQGALTNSMGDYTFSRLSSWPSNLSPVNIPLPVPYGPANEVEGTRLPLLSGSYSKVAFLVNAGVEF